MELVPRGKVVQTANGTLLVNATIPPAAFICVDMKRSGPRTMLWHRSVTGLVPVSVGPAVKALQRGGWVISEGFWGKKTHKSSGDKISASGLDILTCPSCNGQFMSGSVICESCGGTCFYENMVEENDAYVAALGVWMSEKNQRKIDEMGDEERRGHEEVKQAKSLLLEKKKGGVWRHRCEKPHADAAQVHGEDAKTSLCMGGGHAGWRGIWYESRSERWDVLQHQARPYAGLGAAGTA